MMDDRCRCKRPDDTFQGVLRPEEEGTGLSLYCRECGRWVEDSWLFTTEEGIPVEVESSTSRDYTSGEDLTVYGLHPTR